MSTLESLQSLIDTNIGLAFAFTLLIGAAIMDQKQYDDFNEQLGGQESKSALAFAEIFGAPKNEEETKKQEQDDE